MSDLTYKLVVFDQLYGEAPVDVLRFASLHEAQRAAHLYEPRRCEIQRLDPDGSRVREPIVPITHIGNR